MRILALSGVVTLLLAAALVTGCGGGEPAETAGDTGDGGETAEEAGETAGEEEAVEEEVVLYPEGTLDPDLVTAETPVQAWALKEAYFAWDSMEVTVAGYPYIFYGDSTTLEEEITLKASPESEEELVTVVFEEPPNVTVAGTDLVAARGTGVLSWTGDLEVTGAELAEPPEELVTVETSPYAYDGVTPIPAGQLADLYTGWMGREVTVEGYYYSTTTSTTDYGTTIRVDLAHSQETYTKYVGCEMAEPIPEETESLMVANRDGVRIRGTVAGESFDNVALENCVIVSP